VDDRLAGYLRLSIPDLVSANGNFPSLQELYKVAPELIDAAIIREVHVYGQSLEIGSEQRGAAQHIGLGTALLHHAEKITRQHGLNKLIVIAAIGTREYYRNRGFELGDLYMTKLLH
jgi:elongator complex protein 3